MLRRGFNERIPKKLVVRHGRKNRLAIVAALDNVLRLSGNNVAWKARHEYSP